MSEDWDLVHQALSANRSGSMFDACERLVPVLCCCCSHGELFVLAPKAIRCCVNVALGTRYICVCVRVGRACVRVVPLLSWLKERDMFLCSVPHGLHSLCLQEVCYLRYSQDAARCELNTNHKQGLRFVQDDASSAAVVQLTVRNSAD